MKTKEQIQFEAFSALKKNNYTGTVCMSTGTGKSKVAIDCIIDGSFQNILISTPRESLKKNWQDELEKWGINRLNSLLNNEEIYTYKKHISDTQDGVYARIVTENIQTCYKWTAEQLKKFDLIIVDEIHTIGVEYSSYLALAHMYKIKVIGLTATPFKEDDFKQEVLYSSGGLAPIVYEYYDSERDKVTNSVKYYVLEYELSDNYKVFIKGKDKSWYQGEASRYNYLTDMYEKAKAEMWNLGATDYFATSLMWMKNGNTDQKKAGAKFFYAVKNRKEFLWKLSSSAIKATALKQLILNNPNNKVLLFSELTSQADRLSPHSVHSNNGDTAKKVKENNKELLESFNSGEIKELSSCLSLTLGLNMSGANWAIFESYSSSKVNATQKKGRLHRLDISDSANIVVIKPLGTQAETWFENAFGWIKNPTIINDVKELIL